MKSKYVAAILAWFLGAFGGHRFYLGQVGKGVLCLVFCWTLIPGIIAFFDTIIFLVMDKHRFDLKYNAEYVRGGNGSTNIYIQNGSPQAGMDPRRGTFQQPVQQYDQQRQYPASTAPGIDREQLGFVGVPGKDRFEEEGDRLYRDYQIREAMAPYRKSLERRKHNPKLHFKLACLYSLEEEVDTALFHLEKAIMQGYDDLERIATHEHLSYVRAQDAYQEFKHNGYRLPPKQLSPPTNRPPRADTSPTEGRSQLDGDLLDQLERLGKMRDAGLLSDGEFAAQKQRLLG